MSAQGTEARRMAERLGPSSTRGPVSGPQGAGAVNARSQNSNARQPRLLPQAGYQATDAAGLRAKWYRQVEYPLQLSALDRQITLAQARLESYQQRVDLHLRYNVAAPPQTDSFRSSNILLPQSASGMPAGTGVPNAIPILPKWPRIPILMQSPEYAPQDTLQPVKAFAPGSSFAHVMGEMQRRAEDAKLELASLVKQRERLAAAGPDGATVTGRALGPGVDLPQRLKAIDTELAVAQFRRQTNEMRQQQFDQLSVLTYSTSYADLREKTKLEGLGWNLRVEGLQQEKSLLQSHASDWQQLQKSAP